MSENKNNDHIAEIPLSTLKPGMYVISVAKGDKGVSVKSEGYILSKSTIDKLKKADIRRVTVDHSKEKKADKKEEAAEESGAP